MMTDKNSFLPKLLGYMGLLPMIVPTILLFLDRNHSVIWSHWLITNAAIILTFVGALHWAFAMTVNKLSEIERRLAFIWSVIPALIAWVALFMNTFYGSILLAIFFILNLARDKKIPKNAGLPVWYLPLRSKLTYTVTTCLLVAAIQENMLMTSLIEVAPKH